MNGAELYCRMTGAGTPVLLLHGYGQTNRIFEQLEWYLAQNHHVILLDSRGHGRSSLGDKPLTISLMAADTTEVIRQLEIEPVSVIGFSDGGNIAMQIASENPACLKSIVAISGNARPEGLKLYFKWLIKIWRGLLKTLLIFRIIPRTVMEMTSLLLHQPQISNATLRQINIPTLLIYGSHDLITRWHIAEIGGNIQGSKTKIIPYTWHFTIVRKWRRYIGAIEQHIGIYGNYRERKGELLE